MKEQNESSMKHTIRTYFVWLLALMALPSCLKEGDKTILVNDPQDIPFITEYLPEDLLAMFGEEHVYFGDQPPVVDLEFKSTHQYVATNLQPPFAPQPGQLSPITHYHKINQQYLQIADYLSKTSEETYCKVISPVYLTENNTACSGWPSVCGAS